VGQSAHFCVGLVASLSHFGIKDYFWVGLAASISFWRRRATQTISGPVWLRFYLILASTQDAWFFWNEKKNLAPNGVIPITLGLEDQRIIHAAGERSHYLFFCKYNYICVNERWRLTQILPKTNEKTILEQNFLNVCSFQVSLRNLGEAVAPLAPFYPARSQRPL
jgi:hypothetical protein